MNEISKKDALKRKVKRYKQVEDYYLSIKDKPTNGSIKRKALILGTKQLLKQIRNDIHSIRVQMDKDNMNKQHADDSKVDHNSDAKEAELKRAEYDAKRKHADDECNVWDSQWNETFTRNDAEMWKVGFMIGYRKGKEEANNP